MRPRFQWGRRSGFGGFNETAEVASMRQQKQLRQLQWDRRFHIKISKPLYSHRKIVFSTKLCLKMFGFCCLNETTEVVSVVSMKPRKQIQRCQWDHVSGFCGVNETMEVDSAVSMRPRNPLWHCGSPCENEYWLLIPLKGYYSKNKYILKHYILIVTRKCKCYRGTPANKLASAVSLIPQKPILAISESNFSANSKPNAKRL
jgi:hypothetical protein